MRKVALNKRCNRVRLKLDRLSVVEPFLANHDPVTKRLSKLLRVYQDSEVILFQMHKLMWYHGVNGAKTSGMALALANSRWLAEIGVEMRLNRWKMCFGTGSGIYGVG